MLVYGRCPACGGRVRLRYVSAMPRYGQQAYYIGVYRDGCGCGGSVMMTAAKRPRTVEPRA